MSASPLSPLSSLRTVVLAGGVGGAKLADGLRRILPPEQLTIIVNTGDDFQHLGLTICPDMDTVMHTLAGVANTETGWGRAGESWRVMEAVGRLAGPDWFRLGDLDLATHLTRTHLLNEGMSLTAVTQHLCHQFGIQHPILPMTNQPAPTLIETEAGILPFQTWFVKERWQPVIKKIHLPEDVRASLPVMQALEKADVVIIAPSNPFVSVAPILNVYPIESMLMDLPKAVIAVTPIIGGAAVKGPAAKMMQEMGLAVSATAVAHHYGELIDGFIYDEQDAGTFPPTEFATLGVNTFMQNNDDRIRLAQDVLQFAQELV
ncbi:MAG: 2-phospho-L-lactate transferase [Ardenticatenaceae bacterium]|nr:2-phospho-L-lactate transferase [Ardenticatenaceae bacterium]